VADAHSLLAQKVICAQHERYAMNVKSSDMPFILDYILAAHRANGMCGFKTTPHQGMDLISQTEGQKSTRESYTQRLMVEPKWRMSRPRQENVTF
jgi:hypothetical protein